MSPPIRFLALIVAGWMGVRAATLGVVPGFTVGYAKPPAPAPPAVIATHFPPLPPVDSTLPQQWAPQPYPAGYSVLPVPMRVPVPYYVPYRYPQYAAAALTPIPARPGWQLPSSSAADGPHFYTPIRPIDDWPVSQIASASFPERRSSPVPPVLAQGPAEARLDRLQMSSWALLRGPPGAGGLAAAGTLGGSQAGARLTYAFNRWIAASLRTT